MFKPNLTHKRKRDLGIERLENRQMMAADVTAFFAADGLHIEEKIAGSANAIEISQSSKGIRVKGIDNLAGGTSTVNGRTFVDFPFSGGLMSIDLRGGRDKVVLAGSLTQSNNKILIDTAGPSGASDDDVIQVLPGVTLLKGLDIQTGPGRDLVSVEGARIGNLSPLFPFADLSIKTGAGLDTVFVGPGGGRPAEVMGNLIVRTHGALTEPDFDEVFMTSLLVHGNTSVTMGGGDDKLTMLGVESEDIFISTDDGNDTAKLQEVRARDDFFAFMGAGNDRLDLTFVQGDEAQISGNDGSDSLTKVLDTRFRKLSQTGWEIINGRRTFSLSPVVLTI